MTVIERIITRDPRIPQARKLIESMISKSDLNYSTALITKDNTLVIIVRETAIYITQLTNIQPGFDICFSYRDIIDLEEDEYEANIREFAMIKSLYKHYTSMETEQNKLAGEDELRGDNEFERLLSLKSADGAEFYKINGKHIGETYFVPIFSGFPSVNKSDKIGINVYNLHDGHFLNVMIIYKKKINRIMKIYFRTIDLGRRI